MLCMVYNSIAEQVGLVNSVMRYFHSHIYYIIPSGFCTFLMKLVRRVYLLLQNFFACTVYLCSLIFVFCVLFVGALGQLFAGFVGSKEAHAKLK